MSETSGFSSYAGTTSQMRTLAVRITDDLRAQLDVIAQLNGRSVTEEVHLSLEDWIERSKSDPQVLKRAETVRADIEREAQTKRNAIEAIFAKKPASPCVRPRQVRAPRREAVCSSTWRLRCCHSLRAVNSLLYRHRVVGYAQGERRPECLKKY